MTDAQKAKTFDLLQETKVIQVRKGKRWIDNKETQATWIEHGGTKDIIVEDYVTTLEAERTGRN
jgi:hypothetical protein